MVWRLVASVLLLGSSLDLLGVVRSCIGGRPPVPYPPVLVFEEYGYNYTRRMDIGFLSIIIYGMAPVTVLMYSIDVLTPRLKVEMYFLLGQFFDNP